MLNIKYFVREEFICILFILTSKQISIARFGNLYNIKDSIRKIKIGKINTIM